MMAVIAGIILVTVAVLLWAGTLGLVHALAIFISIVGLLLALYYVQPGWYSGRRRV